MTSIDLVVVYEATTEQVWSELADLRSHPEWMRDAASVQLSTGQASGVGTRFRVPTRVGPLRTVDVMTVIEWEAGRSLAVRHDGVVRGVGRFEIRPVGSGTELTWKETLSFPWWLGGDLGAFLARPVLRRVWEGNLRRLGERLGGQRPLNSA